MEAFCDRRILRLILAYFLALTGALGAIYWIPTFVKRLSGFSTQMVTSLLLIPALIGIAGMLINGWHSDRTTERHWHSTIPFSEASFDAITCIDAVNHFSDRPRVIAEWARLLMPGGRLLFTDPIIVTGPLTNAEVEVRSSGGFYYPSRIRVRLADYTTNDWRPHEVQLVLKWHTPSCLITTGSANITTLSCAIRNRRPFT